MYIVSYRKSILIIVFCLIRIEYSIVYNMIFSREVQWSTGEDNPGMGDEMEAAYDEFLRGQS